MNPDKYEDVEQPTLTPEQLRAYYDKCKRELTEEDIKWFENPGELVPFETVLSRMDEILKEKGLGAGGNE